MAGRIPTSLVKLNELRSGMPSTRKPRPFRQASTATYGKALLLPLPRREASNLALRTRIMLERLRNGDTDRALLQHLFQVMVLTAFVARAGFGQLDAGEIDRVQQAVGQLFVEEELVDSPTVPDALMLDITAVVNEYDRQLMSTRLEILARARDYLDGLMASSTAVDGIPA